MPIQTAGIVGAGTMGNGIAHVFAKSGYRVLLCDVEQSVLDRAVEAITRNLERELEKQRITAGQRDQALDRISTSVGLSALKTCDFLVEAASEKLEIKAGIFRELD